jgi:signal transduction histidine kinase
VSREELDRIANGKPAAIHVSAYGTSDGLETSQMFGGTQPAGWRTSRGDLWFPSVRGAVKIDPNHLPQSGPPIALIERVVSNKAVLPVSREVVIPPGRGKLQIDFTACDLMAPQRVGFSYKLEGFEDSWALASKSRSATYSSLPPGHYRFRVIAANPYALAVSSEDSVSIYLKPAFYQTGWFYAMWAAILLGAIWSGISIYVRQTRTRFALLLGERSRLAREMHDTVIQGCIGVSALLEAAAGYLRSNRPGAAQLLDEARSQVKATLEEARQAVWDLRHSTGEESAIANLFDLAQKLGREYAVKVVTEVEGARIPLDPATDRTLLLVGREALRNSVTHAKPSRILLRIAFESTLVRMEVRDDGLGFDAEYAALEAGRHFGIIGMRERIEQMGGQFELSSGAGEGTRVTASLPSHAEENVTSLVRSAAKGAS